MKKFVFRTLTLLAAVALVATGCEKQPKTPADDALNGTYTMSITPMYGTATATNPDATAIELSGDITGETTTLTYRQIIGLMETLLPSEQMLDNEAEITLANGSIEIKDLDPEGTDVIFPDPEDGLSASMITYTASGSNLSFLVDVDAIDTMLAKEDPSGQTGEQLHEMLKVFTKGLVVYSEAGNTLTVTLRYNLNGNTLSVYADKALVVDTWACISPVLDEVLPILEQFDPETYAMLSAILPQIDPMLAGFSSLEVGLRMVKK